MRGNVKVKVKGKGENGEASLATSAGTGTSTPLGSYLQAMEPSRVHGFRPLFGAKRLRHFLSCGFVCSVG